MGLEAVVYPTNAAPIQCSTSTYESSLIINSKTLLQVVYVSWLPQAPQLQFSLDKTWLNCYVHALECQQHHGRGWDGRLLVEQ